MAMSMKRKITVSLALTLISLTVGVIMIVGWSFREYGIVNAKEKATVVSELVRDGLTVHMVNGIMDKRHYFMEKINNSRNIQNLWVVRSKSVIDQYGVGLEGEKAKDAIDASVLANGNGLDQIRETADAVSLRVTIPYVASPECLQCHLADQGDVLGAVSMVFDISDVRASGVQTIVFVSILSLIVLALISLATDRGIHRYLVLFDSLTQAIKKAHDGDFSSRITTTLTDEGHTVADLLNSLFTSLSDTISHIDRKITILIGGTHHHDENPLIRTSESVDSLVDIYKFKKTIEVDRDKTEVYNHLVEVVRERVGHSDFALFEVLQTSGKLTMLASTREQWFCDLIKCEEQSVCEECRALRTSALVFSDEFSNICPHFASGINSNAAFMCLPYRVTEEISLLLQVVSKDMNSLERIKFELTSLNNYLDAARPVLETHYLMNILQDSNLHDGLTGLYNRKFLDEFIDHITRQATRTNSPYALLALDIDYFKMVNDTYGHDIGDTVIKGLAETLLASIREADVAVRSGGEEFLVLLFNANEEGATMVAEKIRERFANRTFAANGATIRKTVSIGISIYPKDTDGMWRAIKMADIALYKAKDNGRNLVVRYQPDMMPEGNY